MYRMDGDGRRIEDSHWPGRCDAPEDSVFSLGGLDGQCCLMWPACPHP